MFSSSWFSFLVTVVKVLRFQKRQGFTFTNMHAQPVQLCKEEDRNCFISTDEENV